MAGYSEAWTSTQNLTGTAPTLATDGVDLAGAMGFRIILSANSGATLSGGGSINIYLYDPVIGEWILNPDLAISLTTVHSGVRRVAFPDQAIFAAWGRLKPVPLAVTASAGTTVDVAVRMFR